MHNKWPNYRKNIDLLKKIYIVISLTFKKADTYNKYIFFLKSALGEILKLNSPRFYFAAIKPNTAIP